jgi:4-azaleucine resistance transporter AzlC
MGSAPTFTRDGFLRAFRRAVPMSMGIFVYGMAFGIMAVQAKFTVTQATLMSALMFSGSAQLASVGVLTAGFSSLLAVASTLFLTILVMNARYFLFGATLYPVLHGISALKAYGSLFMLGDGGWLMTMKAHEDGNRDAAYLLGCSVGVYAAWVFGTLAGAFASNLASDPKKLGLDFFLVAFAAAMFGGMFKGKGDVPTVLIAVPVALLAEPYFGFGGALVLAGLAGGLVAFLRAPQTEPAP